MDKIYAYIITALVCFIIVFASLSFFLYNQNKKLKEDLVEAEVSYELLSQNLAEQNKAIKEANKKLQDYEKKLEANKKEYNKKVKSLKKQIDQVKTNDEAIEYLKNMLEGLK